MTRRKSKAAATVAAEQEQETSSQAGTEETHISAFAVSIPDDIDIELLSSFLPGISLNIPSPDTIVSLYRLLQAQVASAESIQADLDLARAEVEKKEVELDQALQDREGLTKDFETTLDKTHNVLVQVQQERDQLAASQTALQTQIASLSSSQSLSSTEVNSLKRRAEDTEREKRDLVGVISRLKEEGSQREEEIQSLRGSLKEARQDHQVLESQIRELRSADTSAKFKLDSLSQQLQLSQIEFDRTSAELTTKSEEFAKYRRIKHSELVQLQASFDALTQTHASTQASLKALQSAHTAQTHQLTQALTRVQDLTGQLAEQDATYASEASGLRRLVGMMEEREKQAKEIVESIEKEWADVGDKAEKREMILKEEIEREKRAREQADRRVEQLENVLDRMGRGELPVPGSARPNGPNTPVRTPGARDLLTEGMMGLSPTVAMASKSQKSGKTFTEVYADYVRLEDEFAKKSAEYDHMDRTLSAVLAQIEERAPILSQQRAEYERLQSEAGQLASQLAQALAERDAQANLAQENSQRLVRSGRENELLQKQLEDLGRQVQSLLKEIGRRDDPTIPSDDDLDQSLPLPPAESIEAVITDNLVLFRSISGLQEQNQKLLKIVRELGEKMESEEKEYRESMEKEQGEAVKEAHEAMQELAAQLEMQKRSSENTIQAYMKERDALKIMLARAEAGQVGPSTSIVNEELGGYDGGLSGGTPDLAKELANVQTQFDAYRTEMGVDSVRLREDVHVAQREASQLGAALAKANAKIEYLTDRNRMTQDQFAMHDRELSDLTKRNEQLFIQYTRIEVECNRAIEDLQAANSHVEQLRNEAANLRAEKKIWESVQSRLVDENRTLSLERSHLSDLMGNVQKMHNDLERSGESDRRRLDGQLQMLEGQTQDLRSQLSQERDAIRHVSLQKEIELREFQGRLDKSIQELSKTREALIGAETSKKHLEERVLDLTKQLQGNEEKLVIYERRSTTINGAAQNIDQDLNREQQLEVEAADLRSALKVAEVDLATARNHVQQFQEISQANESALAMLNASYDEYKLSTEAQITRYQSEQTAFREKIRSAEEEVTQLTGKANELQRTFETERNAWINDKKTLEDAIVDISSSGKVSENDRTSLENEVRQQEQHAKAAEERYSHEVLAHAESIKAVDALKRQLKTAQITSRDYMNTAETAAAKLASSESSWKQQKEALDKEILDFSARCQDLSSQNSILHQHLESVSSQAARIRAAADPSIGAASGEADSSDDVDIKLSELRSVVTYLRKEKEIVDLQLELSKQENIRLRGQIDHLSQNLEDTRATLSEERERAVEAAASEAQHAELVDRINQLNILRESNATLRADCETQSKRARELEAKLKQLSTELEPAKEQARVAQAELEVRDAQQKRLEEEIRRWQERNAQLLSKYDRIDPAEVQSLKDEIQQLKSHKAEVDQAETEHQETVTRQAKRIEDLETALRSHKEAQLKNNQGFKQRLGSLNSEKSQLNATIQDLNTQLKVLVAERDSLLSAKSSLETEKVMGIVPAAHTLDQTSVVAALREERDHLLAEKKSWISNSKDPAPIANESARLWDTEKADLIKARDDAAAQAKAALEQAKTAADEIRNIRFSNEKFQSKIQDLQKARAADNERAATQQAAAVAAAVEKTKSEIPTVVPIAASSIPDDVLKRHSEELRLLEERLTKKHQEELNTAIQAAQREASNSGSGPDQKAVIAAAIAEHEQQLRAQHTEEIASAVERGRLEQAAKGKLKDSQLVKAQKKVKELETQILEWRKAGILPEVVPTVPASTTSNSTPVAGPSNPPSTPVATNNVNSVAGNLPRKPTVNVPTGPAEGAGRGARGTSRGVARGGRGLNIRGAAPGRGGAPSSAAPLSGGVDLSIHGAGKRTREEGEASPSDSLTKRLKPADSSGKPVAIRRPPPA